MCIHMYTFLCVYMYKAILQGNNPLISFFFLPVDSLSKYFFCIFFPLRERIFT